MYVCVCVCVLEGGGGGGFGLGTAGLDYSLSQEMIPVKCIALALLHW